MQLTKGNHFVRIVTVAVKFKGAIKKRKKKGETN